MQPDAQPVSCAFQGRALRQARMLQLLGSELKASGKYLGSHIEPPGKTSYALSMVSFVAAAPNPKSIALSESQVSEHDCLLTMNECRVSWLLCDRGVDALAQRAARQLEPVHAAVRRLAAVHVRGRALGAGQQCGHVC